ncbi:hypothetical protein ABBQ38_014112 [Trebouxia sp. C0009 RCD-2024]
MANALLSHWTVSARADVVCAQTLPHRSSNFHLTRNTWSNNKPQLATGNRSTCTTRVLQCKAVAAAEPAQQQLDVTKMSPLGDRLLVKPEEEAKTTSGGLLLSSGTTKPIQDALIGEVLAVGEDVDIDVKVGSKVLFSKYSSSDVKSADGDVSFVAQKSILATLS